MGSASCCGWSRIAESNGKSICVGRSPDAQDAPRHCLRSRYRLQVDARRRVSSDRSLVAEIAGEIDRPCVHPMLPETDRLAPRLFP